VVSIRLNNNKGYLDCGSRLLNEIVPDFAIKAPGYFWSPAWRARKWDGKVKYITERGYFETGMLPQITAWLKEHRYKFEIVENRDTDLSRKWPIEQIKDFTLRDHQLEAVASVVDNKVAGIPFPRGILAESTNAGKTLIAAGIYRAFRKEPTILLINNKTLFEQFEDELPKILGKDFGVISSKRTDIRNFTMAMVPTVLARLDRLEGFMIKQRVAIVDECHLASSPSYKEVLGKLYNAIVRVGMSGSPLKHKDKTKNQRIRSFFGDILHTTTSKEIEQKGFSSPITIKIWSGNKIKQHGESYADEYETRLVKNNHRNKKIWRRVAAHASKGRIPLLITVQRHEHINQLLHLCPKEFKSDYLIKFIHHKVKNRKQILDEFREGHVDILISSMIIKIGQNLPMIRATVFAGGGDSDINTLQLLGRQKRVHKSKKRTYVDDFMDKGNYLSRHSKHRRNVYVSEGHTVIDKFKKSK
jgi:superfamily II DNA or RNA helicase